MKLSLPILTLLLLPVTGCGAGTGPASPPSSTTAVAVEAPGAVQVKVAPGPPANEFDPRFALGAALDGEGQGQVSVVYSAASVAAMKSPGFHRLWGGSGPADRQGAASPVVGQSQQAEPQVP